METNQDSGQSSGLKPCRRTIVILWEETPPLRSHFTIQPAAIAVDLPCLHRALEYSLANIWIWSSGRYSCVPGSETPSIWVVGTVCLLLARGGVLSSVLSIFNHSCHGLHNHTVLLQIEVPLHDGQRRLGSPQASQMGHRRSQCASSAFFLLPNQVLGGRKTWSQL